MYADPYGYIIWRNLKSVWSRCIRANDCRGCQDAEVLKDVRSLFPCNSRGSSPRYEEFGQKSNCLRTELHEVQIFQWSYSFYWKFYSPLPQNSISDNILIFGSAWHKANVFALPCCKAFVVGICLIFQNAIPNFMISASSAVKNLNILSLWSRALLLHILCMYFPMKQLAVTQWIWSPDSCAPCKTSMH